MSNAIYELRIELEYLEPPIWREVEVPADIKLDKLHEVIQLAMGWTNSHLHHFEKNNIYYMDPELDDEGDSENEKTVNLSDLLIKSNDVLNYEYDFGDSWQHKITLTKIRQNENAKKAICLDGKRACPPEDVGGIGGYEIFLESIIDPDHEEHEENLEWAGGEFNSEKFDVDACNKFLRKLNISGKKSNLYDILSSKFDF